jgi:hypothetical protein
VRISLRLLVEYYLRKDYTFIAVDKQGLSVLVTGYKRFIQSSFLLQLHTFKIAEISLKTLFNLIKGGHK